MNTDEREERYLRHLVETPAGERIRMKCGVADLRSVIADVLSLRDGEAVEAALSDDELIAEMNGVARQVISEWYRESGVHGELAEEIAITLTHAHCRAEARAATRMRDACVAKVRELQRDWDKAQSYDFRDATFYIVAALESLTLDQLE